MAQGLLYAFQSLYVVVNGEGPGLYRVTNTDGDDEFDTVKLLRAFEGSSEHGPPRGNTRSRQKVALHLRRQSHQAAACRKIACPQELARRSAVGKDVGRAWARRRQNWHRAVGFAVLILTVRNSNLSVLVFATSTTLPSMQTGKLFSYDADMEWDCRNTLVSSHPASST